MFDNQFFIRKFFAFVGLIVGLSAQAQLTNFCSPDFSKSSNVVISNAAVVSDTLTVTESQTISDLNVIINAEHEYVGDLTIELTHVNSGVTVLLIDRPLEPAQARGCQFDDLNIELDDAASRVAENACNNPSNFSAPVSALDGAYQPNGTLTAFNGLDVNGQWVLTITDNEPTDDGLLNQWCLNINEYCVASGDEGCNFDTRIGRVTLSDNVLNNGNGVDASSGTQADEDCDFEGNADGYSDFRFVKVNVIPGNDYDGVVLVTPTVNSDVQDEVAIYIDWNNNGKFDDAGEVIIADNTVAKERHLFNIPVDINQPFGDYRMRIRLRWTGSNGEITDPCGDTQLGEVEDYVITVQECVANDCLCDGFVVDDGDTLKDQDNSSFRKEDDEVDPNCFNPRKTAWYKVVVPASGNLIIETVDANFDVVMAAYVSDDNSCSGNLTQIGCSNNEPSGDEEDTITCQTPGDTIFVQIDGASGSFGQFGFHFRDRGPFVDEVIPVHVQCFGDNTGAVIAIGKGDAPYNLRFFDGFDANGALLSTGNTIDTFVFDGLPIGDYSVEFRDFSGCIDTLNTTITQQDEIVTEIDSSACEGETIVVAGEPQTRNGTYDDTLTAENGCDSIARYNLTFKPIGRNTIDTAVCAGDSLEINGNFENQSGQYDDTLTAANGCDSIITYNLTVRPEVIEVKDSFLCEGDSAFFDGMFQKESGTFDDTIQGGASNGCDSIYRVELEFIQDTLRMEDVSICRGDTFFTSDSFYTEPGVYFDTVEIPPQNCERITEFTLEVIEPVFDTSEATICEGDSFRFVDRFLKVSGRYHDTVVSPRGCDSILTLDLTVDVGSFEVIDTTLCEGQELVLSNGDRFNTDGSYNDTIPNANGCDSVIQFNLTIDLAERDTIDTTVCQGDSVQVGDRRESAEGQHRDTVIAADGCDSIIIVNITTIKPVFGNVDSTICEFDSVLWGNRFVFETGSYNDTLFAESTGCDSISILDLTVIEAIRDTNDTSTICEGDSVLYNGRFVKESGFYGDTLTAQSTGCDSILILELVVLPTARLAIDTNICVGESVSYFGETYDTTGVYVDTNFGGASNGCDSITTVQLTVHPPDSTFLTEKYCDGDSFFFNGQQLSDSGMYLDTLVSRFGCDSFIFLHLLTDTFFIDSNVIRICQGDSLFFDDEFIKTPGIYRDTVTKPSGCDSVQIVDLRVDPVFLEIRDRIICSNDSFFFKGQFYKTSVDVTDSLLTNQGCDSLIRLRLKVVDTLRASRSVQLCRGEAVIINGESITRSGTYFDVFTAESGCDSVVTVSVRVIDAQVATFVRTICTGEIVTIGNQTFTKAGRFLDTLTIPASNGCDSIHNVTINVLETPIGRVDTTVCFGDTVTFGGVDYMNPGVFVDTLLDGATNGCDSIMIIVIQQRQQDIQRFNLVRCVGESIMAGAQLVDTGGVYNDTFTNQHGCDSILSYRVRDVEPAGLVLFNTDVACQDETVEVIAGGDFRAYEWSTGSTQRSIIATQGTFAVTVTDFNNCSVAETFEVTAQPGSSIELAQDSFILVAGEEVQLEVIPPLPVWSYQWTGINDLSCADCPDPVLTASITRNYIVKAINNETGCGGSDTVYVEVFDPFENIDIPTTFTPNGDGENDRYRIYGPTTDNIEMMIYDRWGELMFKTELGQRSWDGEAQERGMPNGKYTVVLNYFNELGDIIATEKRFISLIR